MRNFISIIEQAIPLSEKAEFVGDTVQVNDSPVTILKNLDGAGLLELSRRSPGGEVRGLMAGTDIIFWSAFDAVYFEVSRAVGLSYDPDMRVEVSIHEGHLVVDLPIPTMGNAAFKRLLASEDIYFELDGEIMTGDQYTEALRA